MNEDIIRMAQEAGWPEEAGVPDTGSMNLERFAELVRADEREKMRDEIWDKAMALVDEAFAEAIRNRGNK